LEITGAKEILGYTVKATTEFAGKNVWHGTTEISIADGPYKFHGLPGLICQFTIPINIINLMFQV
jgi:GLPGLI family protein